MIKCRTCAELWGYERESPTPLPHPCCVAHPRARTAAVLEAGQGPLSAFGYLGDERHGPFVAYARGPAYGREPVGVRGPARSQGPAHDRRLLHGTAVDTDRTLAGTKAVLELLERGCAFTRPRAPVRYGSPREIGPSCTGTDAPDTPRWWVEARSLCDGRAWHVAADRYVLASCGGRGDSSGLAVGHDWAGAAGRSLREGVERASVRAMADGRLPVRPCAADTPYAAALRRDGWRVEIVATTHLGFPVALCAATAPTGPTVGGCAAGTGLAHAVASATAEAFMKSLAWTSAGTGGTRARGAAGVAGATRAAGALGAARPVSVAAAGVHGFRLSEAVVFGDPPEPLTGEPGQVLAAAGGDALLVDRGNPLLDALGLRATHVLLRRPAAQSPPGPRRDRRLEELLR
ncbi:YcaO-like family protein [Streptomyces halstedii]|uniref:YcaO-like family protein n=1 Tax=Streptomyces halstedii TaxID=1944 RepID=A0ABS6U0P5_STRHA|nr:YcaO-like family protein [Streptomyces halstedii]MBV7674095.1 YcaO-like family protein [Streptomyces halstedii]